MNDENGGDCGELRGTRD